ncbi:MAG: hypothetical protein F4Z28_11295 [Gammaproteobacteria bacterium]|nr:hypothetical protein [Gammaproteobacteria bacterium]
MREHVETNATRIGLAREAEALAAAKRDFRHARDVLSEITYDVQGWIVRISMKIQTFQSAKVAAYMRVLRTLAAADPDEDENNHHTYAKVMWNQMRACHPDGAEKAIDQEQYVNHPVYALAMLKLYYEGSEVGSV